MNLYACSRAGKNLGLKAPDSSSHVHYPRLDISSESSITSLANEIRSTEKRVDVLINNAGTNDTGSTGVPAAEVVAVNFRGTQLMCDAFLPLLSSPGGRIVNVSSVGSSLSNYSPAVRARFRDPKMTPASLDELVHEYLDANAAGQNELQRAGFGGANGYAFSKAGINALTAVLARENDKVDVNCCCPGWVATDMGSIMGQPPKTPEEGARIPVRLAFGDLRGVSGRYWSNPGIGDTGDGRITEW